MPETAGVTRLAMAEVLVLAGSVNCQVPLLRDARVAGLADPERSGGEPSQVNDQYRN